MKDIPLNVKVDCIDGNCGKSSHIIIDPLNQNITHLVVQNDKFPDSSMRLVTLDKVVATTHKSIQLNCTKRELAQMEKFTKTHYINSDSAEYSSFYHPDEHIFDELDLYSISPYVYVDSLDSIPVEEECIPGGEIAIHRGADVEATDGHVGRVDEFAVDPINGHITHLVVRKGHLWNKKELILPLSAIANMDRDLVRLNLDRKTVKSLPAIPLKRFYSLQ